MTKADFSSIMCALDNVENREKQYCNRYCELNPDDRKRREADRDLYLLAIYAAKQEIKRQVKID